MTLQLVIHSQGAEPYEIGDVPAYELSDAIDREAQTISEDAGSDLLDDPGEESRSRLKYDVMTEALAALRVAGDTYRDPTGVLWSLCEVER